MKENVKLNNIQRINLIIKLYVIKKTIFRIDNFYYVKLK